MALKGNQLSFFYVVNSDYNYCWINKLYPQKTDSSITILSYGYCYMTIFSFIIALFYWQTPSLQTLIYLFFAGLILAHCCI